VQLTGNDDCLGAPGGGEQTVPHADLECEYHVAFFPTGDSKDLYGEIRNERSKAKLVQLGRLMRELAIHTGSRITSARLSDISVYLVITIPPNQVPSQVVDLITTGSAIYLAWEFKGNGQSLPWQSFWTRRYLVSKVPLDSQAIRDFISRQKPENKPLD
jgi:REP element-mobilizing transposase RayT